MSTFTLGQLQVRRSGYRAMQLAGPFTSGTVRRCRASRNGMEPWFQCVLVFRSYAAAACQAARTAVICSGSG